MKKIMLNIVTEEDVKVIKKMYKWIKKENKWAHYTCRPLPENSNFKTHYSRLIPKLKNPYYKLYFVSLDYSKKPIGKIVLFDYNPRNKTAEFGYYLPKKNRGKGYGEKIIKKFLKQRFEDKKLPLDKIYATTSSNNKNSIRVLLKNNFILEGELHEHFWIDGKKYSQLIFAKYRERYNDERK